MPFKLLVLSDQQPKPKTIYLTFEELEWKSGWHFCWIITLKWLFVTLDFFVSPPNKTCIFEGILTKEQDNTLMVEH